MRGRLTRAAEIVQTRTPDGPSMIALLEHAASMPLDAAARDWRGADDAIARAVPEGLAVPARPDGLTRRLPAAIDAVAAHRRAIGRWLASKAFGSWIAYQANGLTACTRYLRACLDVLIVEAARDEDAVEPAGMWEAIRRADLLIVHLAESSEIARRLATDATELTRHGSHGRTRTATASSRHGLHG